VPATAGRSGIRFGEDRPAIRDWCALEDFVTSPYLPGFAMTLTIS
jgi:hypothetical protein